MLVSGTAAILSNLISQEALQTWGWRVLFILGLSIYFVGLYMRQYIDESPEFLKAQISGSTTQHPLKEIFSKHKKVLSAVVLTVMTHDLSFYILFIYMTTYLTSVLNLAQSTAFTINTANMFVFGVTTILGAWLSDKFGRKLIVSIFAIYLAILVVPMMQLIATEDPQMIWIAQLVLGFGAGCFFGPIPAMMVESYPTKIRFSAVALTTNISGPIFGGLTPFLMTWLINVLETRMVPAYYLAAGAVISLLAVQFLKKMSVGHSLQSDQGVENLF
jgi:MHS family proline/betaine transporter-like MFS transporter